MSYTVVIPRSVQKQIDKLAANASNQVVDALAKLEKNPRPPGALKLRGRQAWRLRSGDYRII